MRSPGRHSGDAPIWDNPRGLLPEHASRSPAMHHRAFAVLALSLTTIPPGLALEVTTEAPAMIAEVIGSPPEQIANVGAVADLDISALRADAEAVIAGLADNEDGEVYSGAVEGTDPDDLAVAVALIDARTFGAGKAQTRFPLMSISKPFTYALAVQQRGADFMIDKIGVVATGMPYNEVAAGEVRGTTAQNPLVNAGAIATHSYIRGDRPEDKIGAVVDLYAALADAPLTINNGWRAKPRALTYTLAYQMKSFDRLDGDVEDVAERYLEACIVGVTVQELARMGAVLAAGGIQPRTGERVLAEDTVRLVLSVMVIAGMYEDSGQWWSRAGVPAKSGVSGAVLAVVPGWGAIAAYSPRLDAAGNSVRAQRAIIDLVGRWRLHAFDRLMDGRRAPDSSLVLDVSADRP
jgi:glutaminase